jgi:hypothetical protein
MNWISVKDRYPVHKQNIRIKVEDTQGNEHELECTFNDYEDYRGWEIKPPENIIIHAKPTHWIPLPSPPENE